MSPVVRVFAIKLSLLLPWIGTANANSTIQDSGRISRNSPNLEKLFPNLDRAANDSSGAFRQFLQMNCSASEQLDPSRLRTGGLVYCDLLHMLNKRDQLKSEVYELVQSRRVFVPVNWNSLDTRAGFLAINPRLTDQERRDLVDKLTRGIVLRPLLSNLYDRLREQLSRNRRFSHGPLLALAAADTADTPFDRAMVLGRSNPSVNQDIQVMIRRHAQFIRKVADLVKTYDSVVWPEYEAFKPMLRADSQLWAEIRNGPRGSLARYILEGEPTTGIDTYNEALFEFLNIPLQLSDEGIRRLYAAFLFSLDLQGLVGQVSTSEGAIERDLSFQNSFMNEVEKDLLIRLNTITAILRKAENEISN